MERQGQAEELTEGEGPSQGLMKIVSWNVRGLNAPNKQRLVKRCLSSFSPKLVLLQETKLGDAELASFGNRLGFRKITGTPSIGASRGLAIIWDPHSILLSPLVSNLNWMSGRVTCLKNNLDFVIVNMYGPILNDDKKRVWEEIKNFTSTLSQVCFIGGDFNAILHQHEKQGGSSNNAWASLDFADWIHRSGMLEINMVKDAFTWNNWRLGFSNIAEKMDRFFVLGSLINFPFTLEASILPFSRSDHFPISLDIQREASPKRCPFKFENIWLKDDHILELLKEWWNGAMVLGSENFKVVNKLKIIKKSLIQWNREHFSDIFDKKAQVEVELAKVNKQVMRYGMDETLFLKEKKLMADHESILAKEEFFWKQKSRETWLEVGDKNTKFFHNSVRMRRVRNHISRIKVSNGSEVVNPIIIAKEVVDFFSLILNSDWSPHNLDQDMFIKSIPRLLNKEHFDVLNAKFSLAEVEAALKQMSPDNSLGLDGFPTSFFQLKALLVRFGFEIGTHLAEFVAFRAIFL
ncbi:uncharacterized protein LOC131874050 [Cryptomeria japonica]|uniref:uncharacterized protein LOC131874050 n=1 Tax=Cryptomeria japonica TaxID=3369 RepID=UPI0027D9E0B1|nr:uncharacterized protein LOC131874050 [Cryptomeria japonica]